ncbi:FAD binding domain-containing protein [Terriglobus saanensis]|uniref:Molybdopterin dehydrogenase FAD-binding protein n=1 Tax=Terriglobus saanensis (strain ATCC BAA-1853 / DSM 23119 / SP1PR4) TaxID=401053 RepID=E8V6N6_TERSS|nr:xanthine dehydrogenase family protein subunit M [Terriglobus saanensis]ADV82775.1 molybdopterin dehydrogenase FAD-binding protein [Terriglobus saanensis SP1PR4]
MNPFAYQRVTEESAAVHAIAGNANAKLLGGGTNLIDLMKDDVEHPTTLVDITRVPLNRIEDAGNGGAKIGALVRNSDLANDGLIRARFPLLSMALLSGASAQLRNLATTGGNLMQRTRCYYFMDTAFPECNKRKPGSGCGALRGFNRIHAILGQSEECIATNPSDMNVAMAALGAEVHVEGPKGKRMIPFHEFHRLPGKTPQVDTNLAHNEMITGVTLPAGADAFAPHSYYLKVRDRQSYAFALVSVAAGLVMDGNNVKRATVALGGVAHKPWRMQEAEDALVGKPATPQSFAAAAEILLRGAKGYEHNQFKVELAKRSIVKTLTMAAQGGVA